MTHRPVIACLLTLLAALPAAGETLDAGSFNESGGAVGRRSDGGVVLVGASEGAWVAYELTPPPWAVSFSLALDWWLVRPGDGCAVYIYDHAATGPDEIYGHPDLDHHWRLWQVSSHLGRFASSNPRFLLLDGGNPGGLRPRGPQGRLRVLVRVDGGVPLFTDELAVLEELEVVYSDRDELWRPTSPDWSDLYLAADAPALDYEKDLLAAEGRGRAPLEYRDSARGRLMAERAALVNALQNAVVALNEQVAIQLVPDELPGYRIIESRELDDGYWSVRVGIPLNGPGGLAEHLGYHRILPKSGG